MRSHAISRFALVSCLITSLAGCSSASAPGASNSPAAPAATSPGTSAEAPSSSGNAVTITGVEYAYEGLPERVEPGTVVSFKNGGTEVHEIIAVRRNEGVTTTLDELLAMSETESDKLVTFLGVAIASPGETALDTITLDQPGSYIFLCFIPVGTTELPSLAPDATPSESLLPDGPPHFTQGMLTEFNVTE